METEVKKPTFTLEDIKKRPLSYSSLKEFKKSPLHFLHYRNNPKDREATEALIFGGLLDCLLLTPDDYTNRYVIANAPKKILPERKTLKDNGREEYDRYKAECEKVDREHAEKVTEYEKVINDATKVIITQEQYDKAVQMRDIIYGHPVATKILQRVNESQCELRWLHKPTGLWVVGKFDGMGDDFILELKTAKNADPEQFMKDAFNYDYHIQCATYLEAMARKNKFPDFWYIVIEKTAPYGISVMRPSDEYIQLGKQELAKMLQQFKYCMDADKFTYDYRFKSPFEDGTHLLELPPWAHKKLES